MIRNGGWLAVLVTCLALFVGCSDGDSADSATTAPATGAAGESGLTLAIDPASPAAGETVELLVEGPSGVEATYGADVLLERRDGEAWVASHTLVAADVDGVPTPIDEQVTVPAIAYAGGEGVAYALPEVGSGRYRVSREVAVTGVPGVVAETLTAEFEITS